MRKPPIIQTSKQREFLESLRDPKYVVEKGVCQAMNDLEAEHSDYIKYTEVWELNGITIYHVDIYVRDDVDIYTTENRIIDMEDDIKHYVQKYNKKATIEFDRHLLFPDQIRNKDKFFIVVRV